MLPILDSVRIDSDENKYTSVKMPSFSEYHDASAVFPLKLVLVVSELDNGVDIIRKRKTAQKAILFKIDTFFFTDWNFLFAIYHQNVINDDFFCKSFDVPIKDFMQTPHHGTTSSCQS